MFSGLFFSENTGKVVVEVFNARLDHILEFAGPLAHMARGEQRDHGDGGQNDPHADHLAGHIQNSENRDHNTGFTH